MKYNFFMLNDKFSSFIFSKKGKKLKAVIFVFIIIGIIASQLFFNVLTQLNSDDYSYSFSWANNQKLSSFSELLPSIIAHNQILNGRTVNHFIAQFFLLLNNLGFGILFDLFNSLVYPVLIFLIYYHSKGSFKNIKLWWIVSIHLCLWIFVPDYAGCFYWLVGSCNYSWSIALVLLFMVPFTYYSNKPASKKSNILFQIVLTLLYIPCGIIAGNTNENTAVATIIMIVLFGIKFLTEKKNLRPWMFSGLIGVLAGFGAMILSPGQQARAEQSGGFGGIGTWIKNAFFITFDVFEYLAVPLALLFVALILVFASNKGLKLKNFSSFLIFLIGSGSAIYCMVVSPQFPERAWTTPVIFAIIAFGQLISLIEPKNDIYRKTICALLVIGTICFGTSYISSYLDIKQTVIAYNEREEYIEQQLEEGETVLLLKPVSGWAKYNIFNSEGDLGDSSDEWPNTAIARYYGVEKIINSNSAEGVLYENSKQATAP